MIGAILIGIGVMTGLSGVLALLMVLADATLGNYGRVTIDVNGDRQLEVDGGQSLLSTLKDNEIFIPSACGGRGSCGLCKLRILDGAGDALPTELPWLTPAERKTQVRLSCQVKVKQNLRIEIPAELLSVRQFRTRVLAIRDLTHDIKEVRLKLLDPPRMDFEAGAFVQFEVPAYKLTDEPVYRAYSISSTPEEHDEIELEIRLVPNGICTTYVFQYLKEGDAVTINGPHGDFRLSDTEREMICIAGGSGMAPLKSILLDMRDRKLDRKTTYFFGARARRDLFLVEEMHALESVLPRFRFVPVLSEPAPDDDWEGETGLVTEAVERDIGDASEMEAYLCGSPLMIDACIKVLKDKGMPESQIFYDKFS